MVAYVTARDPGFFYKNIGMVRVKFDNHLQSSQATLVILWNSIFVRAPLSLSCPFSGVLSVSCGGCPWIIWLHTQRFHTRYCWKVRPGRLAVNKHGYYFDNLSTLCTKSNLSAASVLSQCLHWICSATLLVCSQPRLAQYNHCCYACNLNIGPCLLVMLKKTGYCFFAYRYPFSY